jgi:hypothetical protein
MKKTKHTPEPWKSTGADQNDEYGVWSVDGRNCIAEGLTAANARRIVACVNACRSVSDEDLADDCVEKMRMDRDQLLEKTKKFCLQCGTPLILKSVAADPVYPYGPQATACSTCGSRSYDVPGNKIKELTAQRDELLAALRQITMQGVSDQHRPTEERLFEKLDIARKALEKYHA